MAVEQALWPAHAAHFNQVAVTGLSWRLKRRQHNTMICVQQPEEEEERLPS